MARSEEAQKQADAMFDKLRDDLLKRDLSNTENYDKTVLALSTVALGFSLTVVKDLVTISTAHFPCLLYISWFLLSTVVISSISAYIIGNKGIERELEKARDYYKNGIEDAFERKNGFRSVNSFLNYFSGIGVSFEIIILVTFISINISKESGMSEKNQTSNVEKSANIPSMEKVTVPGSAATNSANIPTGEKLPSTTTTSSGGSSSSN